MSILLELLAKIKKTSKPSSGVNPSLKVAVASAKGKGFSRDKTMKLVFLALLGFLLGGGVLFYLEFMRPVKITAPPRRQQPAVVQQQQSSARTATIPPVQTQLSTSKSVAVQPPRSTASRRPAADKPVIAKKKAVASRPKLYRQAAHPLAPPVAAPVAAKPQSAPAPESAGRSHVLTANRDALLFAARDAEVKKDLHQALRLYRQLLQSEPDNYRIHNNIAGICIQQGNFGDALASSRQALSIQSGYVPALINAGIASAQLGKDQEAAETFGKVLTIEPHQRSALYNLALLREKSGGIDEAVALYRRLCDAGDLQGYIGLGRIAERRQRPTEARQAYRAVLSVPSAPSALQNVAKERLRQLE